jgi:hypothetical protein
MPRGGDSHAGLGISIPSITTKLGSLAIMALVGAELGSSITAWDDRATRVVGAGFRAHPAWNAEGANRPPRACRGDVFSGSFRVEALRLRGGYKSNVERWRSCGYNLNPDLRPSANQQVPINTKLGDAAELGEVVAVKELLEVTNPARGCSDPLNLTSFEYAAAATESRRRDQWAGWRRRQPP